MSFRATPALLRTALALSAAGAALVTGAGAAQASQLSGALGGALEGVSSGIAPAKHLKLDPMAGTVADPLTNGVGTQIADFKPIGTKTVTGPLTDGDSLSELPLLGPVSNIVPG
jgi:hypothetical protein